MTDTPPDLTATDFYESALSGHLDSKIEVGRKLATVLSEARELKRLSLRELEDMRRRIAEQKFPIPLWYTCQLVCVPVQHT